MTKLDCQGQPLTWDARQRTIKHRTGEADMPRFAILLGAAVASLLLAAPVPTRPPAFGASGVVTKAELDALPCALADVPHLKGLGIGLHLPRRRVPEGEPIP